MTDAPVSRRLFLVLTAVALVGGGLAAASWWWMTDDAFISFRYAQNLVEGRGLVFNAGERVEGYTNFLWTLWIAAGVALGVGAEGWAGGWGIAFYLASILLIAAPWEDRRGWALPVAALGAAAFRDWSIFATGGLETSMFTFLLLAGYTLALRGSGGGLATPAAGFVMALAAMTRPDGVLPAAVIGLWLLTFARPRWRVVPAYALAFAALWLPFMGWRWTYYGDLFPNSYYAKSAYLAWYEQGWHYLALYLARYWALLAGPLLLAGAALAARRRGGRAAPASDRDRRVLLLAALAGVYTFYVVRVGGDFMFARLLIPTAPFCLLLLELGLRRAFDTRRAVGYGAAGLLVAALLWTPMPVGGAEWRHGIADERDYYTDAFVARYDHAAEVLGRVFEGLPVRVAFFGSEARLVYKAGFPVAIEGRAGLTEPEVARQKLTERGRVGHEKHASAEYLIERRRAHFTFSETSVELLELSRYIPEVVVQFDPQVLGQVLHWDPPLMESLVARGARVPDFLGTLDDYIAVVEQRPDDEVAELFERLKRFYFDHVNDPARRAVFERRLGRAGTADP
jgi:hypothetical protein